MVCEVNIKWWNKSTVDWTLAIIVLYSQIWQNLLMDDCHCGYIDHKIAEKEHHTPFWEKRYQKEQPPSKGHKRVPKVTAGIEYSAVNSKRVEACTIAAATPK
jgi:hypothetical protein